MYRKLKRTWSQGYAEYIPNFKKVFPELSKVSSEELCYRFIEMKIHFYYEEKTPVKLITRLSLPFALMVMFIMFILLPFNFLITGHWNYAIGKNNLLLNWFRSLRLI